MNQYKTIAEFWTVYIRNLFLNKTANLELNDNDVEQMMKLAKVAENLHQKENSNNEENSSQSTDKEARSIRRRTEWEPDAVEPAQVRMKDRSWEEIGDQQNKEANQALEKYGYKHGTCNICGKEGWVKDYNGKLICLSCYTIMQD